MHVALPSSQYDVSERGCRSPPRHWWQGSQFIPKRGTPRDAVPDAVLFAKACSSNRPDFGLPQRGCETAALTGLLTEGFMPRSVLLSGGFRHAPIPEAGRTRDDRL